MNSYVRGFSTLGNRLKEMSAIIRVGKIRSDFLGRMGHEMRNPMNSILGMTHLLLETPLTDQQRKYLSILRKSSEGLLEVLTNLLDFSCLESGTLQMEKTHFDLYKLLEKSMDLAVYGAHANEVELILDLAVDVPLRLKGDPIRLQQILSNLLGNAIKFTHKGQVTLKVQLEVKGEELGKGDCAQIRFSVVDTGMGIHKKKMNVIFDAFVQEDSTVRRRFGGTGLGLSISKDLVSLLGGAISVESEKNKGSCFHFSIPLEVTETATVEKFMSEFDLDSETIVVMDPNESVSGSLAQLIGQCGGQVTHVKTLDEFKKVLSQMSQDPVLNSNALALVDYESVKEILPTLFSKIRRGMLKADSFLFLVKTSASSSDLEKLGEYGIRNFIFKPLRPLQLLESISQCLSGEKAAERPETLQNENELPMDNRPLRVLAVDDSKDNQFLVKAYLASLPYRITFAENGLDGIEKFKDALFDVVLMDLQMPEMDGYTATRLIRDWEKSEKLSAVPIIAVSAHNHESGSRAFIKAGFSSYLIKPISAHQLRLEILKTTQHLASVELTVADSALLEIEKQLSELAPVYLKNRELEVQGLRVSLKRGDFCQIQNIAHKIKGNAKSYGFEGLGQIGGMLEEAAREKDFSQIQHCLQQVESYLKVQMSRS